MSSEKWSFDKEAAAWDQNPGRVKLVGDIANAIRQERVLSAGMDVLEFGCGTGLLTLLLQPLVHSITGVDSSKGMLGVLRAKIESQGLTNVRTAYVDLDLEGTLEGSYQLVVSSMTLHHIREVGPLLGRLHKVTAPEGHLCIADLDPEGGRFHGENDTVFHCGFDRAELRRAFEAAGFDDVRDRTAANMVKTMPDGEKRSFSVFLMIGRKTSHP